MSNLATLKPFRKGHDPRRNVKGRIQSTKDKTLNTYLKEYLSKSVNTPNGKKVMAQLIAERVMNDALKGDLRAIKFVIERIDGKAISKSEMMRLRGMSYDQEPERVITPEEEAELDRIFGRH